jgi:hypothetical protein
MTNTLLDFIRRVNLSTEVSYDLRDEALNILINAVRMENAPSINIYYDDGRVAPVAVPFESYNEIVSYLKNGQLINAIKTLRTSVASSPVLGLREAKISVENLRDQLGIVPPVIGRI